MADFISSDLFTQDTLTPALNKVPVALGPIAMRKLFGELGIPTTGVQVEQWANQLRLVQANPRGAPAPVHQGAARTLASFEISQLRERATVYADSVQNKREYGEASPTTVQREIDRVLTGMRTNLEGTIEYHRFGALNGNVLNADGVTMVDLFSEFGVLQNSHDMLLDTTTTIVGNQVIAAKRKAEAELGAANPTSWVAFASPGFMDAFRGHPNVYATHEGWIAAAALSADLRDGFPYAGVLFVEVRNPPGITMIEDGAAFLCPEGVPGLFETYFAPADYAETVNTEGLPMYAKAHELPFSRGYMIEAQSNPLSIVTRPRAVVKLTA